MAITKEQKTFEVLLVEDNLADVFLIKEILKKSLLNLHLNVALNGEAAMAYLRQEGYYSNTKKPDMLLLDLNLPLKNGWEVLAEVKENAAFRNIPVMIVTTSSDLSDIQQARELKAYSYIVKSLDVVDFSKIVGLIEKALINDPQWRTE